MKIKTKFLAALIVCALLALLTVTATAGGVGSVSFGITNASLAINSTNTALGQNAVVVDQQDSVQLAAYWSTTATNASVKTFTLYRADADGNVETTSPITFTAPDLPITPGTTATNACVAFTNLSSSVIGQSYSLVLSNVINTNAVGVMLNPTLKVWKKRLLAPN